MSNKTPSKLLKTEFVGLTVIVARLVQAANVWIAMLVSPVPIITLVKPVQLPNAQPVHNCPAMLVTLSGIVMVVKLGQFLNVPSHMQSTLSGIAMLVRLEQPSNALTPISVTLFGIVTLVRFVQLQNAPPDAPPLMAVTNSPLILFGMVTALTGGGD